jgi:aspartate/methionine/tyrosine aminotransferase
VSEHTNDGAALAQAMLRQIGVSVTPGIDFDPDRGRRFVRLSSAGPQAAMCEAARRIRRG